MPPNHTPGKGQRQDQTRQSSTIGCTLCFKTRNSLTLMRVLDTVPGPRPQAVYSACHRILSVTARPSLREIQEVSPEAPRRSSRKHTFRGSACCPLALVPLLMPIWLSPKAAGSGMSETVCSLRAPRERQTAVFRWREGHSVHTPHRPSEGMLPRFSRNQRKRWKWGKHKPEMFLKHETLLVMWSCGSMLQWTVTRTAGAE